MENSVWRIGDSYEEELNEWKEKREQALLMVSYFSSR